MRIIRIVQQSAMAIGVVGAVACSGGDKPSANTAARDSTTTSATLTTVPAVTPAQLAVFAPLPATMANADRPSTPAQVTLGRQLFNETVLSNGHDVSCASCHALNGYGADGRRVSFGSVGHAGSRNAPSVYNAAGHLAQFWDGRAATVEEQAKGPVLNPAEMAMPDSNAVLAHLRGSASYRAAFRAAFPGESEPVTYDNVGRAIGAFERGLVTPGRWDAYLRGDSTALTAVEREGLATFVATGCTACHAGAYVGGGSYQKLGRVTAWPTSADSGRFKVTGKPEDLMVFKVPSLRNVAKTGPYFHDGSVADLHEAVRLMAHHQLGKELSAAQITSLVAWLGALTGELPAAYIAYPQQPATKP
jgi:cytochrome c peroxidase